MFILVSSKLIRVYFLPFSNRVFIFFVSFQAESKRIFWVVLRTEHRCNCVFENVVLFFPKKIAHWCWPILFRHFAGNAIYFSFILLLKWKPAYFFHTALLKTKKVRFGSSTNDPTGSPLKRYIAFFSFTSGAVLRSPGRLRSWMESADAPFCQKLCINIFWSSNLVLMLTETTIFLSNSFFSWVS